MKKNASIYTEIEQRILAQVVFVNGRTDGQTDRQKNGRQ